MKNTPTRPADLRQRKDALVKGERAPSRVFRIEKRADGTFSRVAVNPMEKGASSPFLH